MENAQTPRGTWLIDSSVLAHRPRSRPLAGPDTLRQSRFKKKPQAGARTTVEAQVPDASAEYGVHGILFLHHSNTRQADKTTVSHWLMGVQTPSLNNICSCISAARLGGRCVFPARWPRTKYKVVPPIHHSVAKLITPDTSRNRSHAGKSHSF